MLGKSIRQINSIPYGSFVWLGIIQNVLNMGCNWSDKPEGCIIISFFIGRRHIGTRYFGSLYKAKQVSNTHWRTNSWFSHPVNPCYVNLWRWYELLHLGTELFAGTKLGCFDLAIPICVTSVEWKSRFITCGHEMFHCERYGIHTIEKHCRITCTITMISQHSYTCHFFLDWDFYMSKT